MTLRREIKTCLRANCQRPNFMIELSSVYSHVLTISDLISHPKLPPGESYDRTTMRPITVGFKKEYMADVKQGPVIRPRREHLIQVLSQVYFQV